MASGVRCIKYAASFLDDSYDLVITNIVMPEMDGNELLMHIKNKKLPAKVIVMSECMSYSLVQFDVAKALGAKCCIRKPFTEQQMLDEIISLFYSEMMVC